MAGAEAPLSPQAARVLDGAADYDELDSDDQRVVRAAWAARTMKSVDELDLAVEFEAAGQAYYELDGTGQVVRHCP